MNLIEEFNRLNSPGIISHLVKITGMPFDRINAGLRDGDFTEAERERMELALIKWENKPNVNIF